MKMWITKYALSGGIKCIDAEFAGGNEYIKETSKYSYSLYKVGREAFEIKSDAIADAENRCQKKIMSLKKQIKKLEKLVFE